MRSVDGVAHRERITEAGRHDADNGELLAVDLDGAAEDGAVAREVSLPCVIAKHKDFAAAFLLVTGKPGAAKQRADAEDLKEIVGGADAREQNRAAAGSIDGGFAEVVVAGKRGERTRLRA